MSSINFWFTQNCRDTPPGVSGSRRFLHRGGRKPTALQWVQWCAWQDKKGTGESRSLGKMQLQLDLQTGDDGGAAGAEALGVGLKGVHPAAGALLALGLDRKSTRLNSSHEWISRMPSSA